jgi:hypothetical protein
MDPEGFYFPAWCFTMGGQLKWSCSIQQNDRWETVHDSKILLHTDILVAATRRIPEGIAGIVKTYQLRDLISFDPHYLADWNAETYQITVSDASLTARKMVLDSEKKQISDQYDSRILNLKIDSTSMAVDTVKLILLPVWITSYQQNGVNFDIAVNGQNGRVVGQQPAPGLSDWINEIFSK